MNAIGLAAHLCVYKVVRYIMEPQLRPRSGELVIRGFSAFGLRVSMM